MLFIIALDSFVGVSVYLSFHSVPKEKYTYKKNEKLCLIGTKKLQNLIY